MQNKNKYAMVVNKDATMVNMSGDCVFGFCMVNASNKYVFVFLHFLCLKMKSTYEVLERCFL